MAFQGIFYPYSIIGNGGYTPPHHQNFLRENPGLVQIYAEYIKSVTLQTWDPLLDDQTSTKNISYLCPPPHPIFNTPTPPNWGLTHNLGEQTDHKMYFPYKTLQVFK